MDGDPARHGVPHRRIFDISVGRRQAGHVEVNRIVSLCPTLPHLIELHSLDLERQEALAHHVVGSEIASEVRAGGLCIGSRSGPYSQASEPALGKQGTLASE